jgi:hypothetical protein
MEGDKHTQHRGVVRYRNLKDKIQKRINRQKQGRSQLNITSGAESRRGISTPKTGA